MPPTSRRRAASRPSPQAACSQRYSQSPTRPRTASMANKVVWPLPFGTPSTASSHILGRQLQRLRERLALDHGADGACAAGHGKAPAALEAATFTNTGFGNRVVDHREQAQRHLAALRLAHHALHVEALGLAGVLEVRHDGEHRFRVAFHAVVQLGLVHVLRADERTVCPARGRCHGPHPARRT